MLDSSVTSTYKLYSNVSLASYTNVSFTESESNCDNLRRGYAQIYNKDTDTGLTALADFNLLYESTAPLYICLDENHQGTDQLVSVTVAPPANRDDGFPEEISIFIVCILLCLSGLFSGLNLGLMALDTSELSVVMRVGSERERGWAKKIYPLRKRGNLLLCSVLLGNVLVNAVLTILLDGLLADVNPVIPIVGATMGIVIFGEIIPQAICTRHGLQIGATVVPLVYLFVVLTSPLAYPISKFLDYLLGRELGTVLNRKHIVELIKEHQDHNDLDKDEIEMVAGALTYADRSVSEIMTQLGDVFMLPITAILDFKTISDIFAKGHSRIPVYENERENIIGVLFMKELAFVDPDDCTELSTIIKFYKHNLDHVDDDMKLDDLLSQFIRGRSHMVVVQRIVDPGDGRDPYRQNIGVATLEDVIEEIIQAEIVDETDVIQDNRSKLKLESKLNAPFDSRLFPKELEGDSGIQGKSLTEQMALAAFTFLSANIPSFSDEQISKKILQQLIKRSDCATFIDKDSSEDQRQLYKFGAPLTHFALVLEGNLKVTVGKEKFSFDSGPFSSLGASALETQGQVTSDFSAVVESEEAVIFFISKKTYQKAREQTQISQQQQAGTPLVQRAQMAKSQSGASDTVSVPAVSNGGPMLDTTGDGRVDTVLADTTGDGKLDTVLKDTTGDGKVDSSKSISNRTPAGATKTLSDAVDSRSPPQNPDNESVL